MLVIVSAKVPLGTSCLDQKLWSSVLHVNEQSHLGKHE